MDLAAIETGLGAWLGITARNINKDGNDIGPMPVEYGRRPKKVHTGPFVLVYLGPIGKLGWDFPRYFFDELTDKLVEQMRGVRRMPVRFSFRAFSQDWGLNARQFAEDFRIRLKKDTAMAALGAAKLALFDSTDLIETDYEYSGRLISQVDLTVVFGLCAFERNATDDVGYIKNVNIEGRAPVVDQDVQQVVDKDGNAIVTDDKITINVVTE